MADDLMALRARYADALDNISKLARVECDNVRDGQPWDLIMVPVLHDALSIIRSLEHERMLSAFEWVGDEDTASAPSQLGGESDQCG